MNMTELLPYRSTRRNHIVHDQHASGKRRTHEVSAFAMILHFLAIETEREVLPALSQGNGYGAHQRNTLIRGAKKHVEWKLRSLDCFGVKLTQLSKRLAIIE